MRFVRRFGFLLVLMLLAPAALALAPDALEPYANVILLGVFFAICFQCFELRRVERAQRLQKDLPRILQALSADWFSRVFAIHELNQACGRHYGAPFAPGKVSRVAELWRAWLVKNYDRLVWDDLLGQWICEHQQPVVVSQPDAGDAQRMAR